MSLDKQTELFEEKRKYPRIIINAPAQIQYAEGKSVNIHIYDISPEGLQVRCDDETAELLRPSNKPVHKDKKAPVKITFSLLYNNKEREIDVSCHILYITVPENVVGVEHNVALGLKFIRFQGEGKKITGRFIYNEMKPT